MTPTGRSKIRSTRRGPASPVISLSSLGPTPSSVRISAKSGNRIEGRMREKEYGPEQLFSTQRVLYPPHDGRRKRWVFWGPPQKAFVPSAATGLQGGRF